MPESYTKQRDAIFRESKTHDKAAYDKAQAIAAAHYNATHKDKNPWLKEKKSKQSGDSPWLKK